MIQELIDAAGIRETQRIAAIDQAFPNDPDFVITAIARGWTVERAKLEASAPHIGNQERKNHVPK